MKKIFLTILTAAFALSLSACGNGTKASNNNSSLPVSGESTKEAAQSGKTGEPIKLKLAHILNTNDIVHELLVEYADTINEKSEGRIEITVFPNGELGNNKESMESVVRGSDVITFGDFAYVGDYVPDYSVFCGPYLFDDYKDITKLAESDFGKELEQQASDAGIKVLCADFYFGTRHTMSKKPFANPDEMKNLKVRVPSTKMWQETISAMGGNPTVLDWSEVYTGLSQGVVDAVENPLAAMYAANIQEVAKHLCLTQHFVATVGLEMSQKQFDAMPADLQELLVTETRNFSKYASEKVAENENLFIDKFKEAGVEVHEVDVQSFREATEVVYEKFPEWTPGVYERALEALGK